MAAPLVIEGYVGAIAPLLVWDGQSVIVHICPFCGYWPINGEETKAVCRCGNRPEFTDDASIQDIYRVASGQQWLTPVILKRLGLGVYTAQQQKV